jgi:hypothetical protein
VQVAERIDGAALLQEALRTGKGLGSDSDSEDLGPSEGEGEGEEGGSSDWEEVDGSSEDGEGGEGEESAEASGDGSSEDGEGEGEWAGACCAVGSGVRCQVQLCIVHLRRQAPVCVGGGQERGIGDVPGRRCCLQNQPLCHGLGSALTGALTLSV